VTAFSKVDFALFWFNNSTGLANVKDKNIAFDTSKINTNAI